MYYAKKNGLQANQPQQVAQQVKPQPPMVETPGNGTQNPKLQGVNETDLRNARNARERNNILYALLNNRIKR